MKTQFTPIAMACTKKQYKSIASKLNQFETNGAHDIEEYNYLTNSYNERGFVNIGTINKKTFPNHNVEWIETWNEATFLKACGIDVTPSLEEVKKHFENAKEVKDCVDTSIINIDTIRWNEKFTRCVICDSNSDLGYTELYYLNENQYAEIISHKDTYTVDKEFIKEAYDNPELLKDKFPSVFVSDIIPQVNKWYWMNCNTVEDDYLVLSNGKGLEGKVWIINGSYIDYVGTFNSVKRLATDKEVEEALINEAKRRGFKEGAKIKNHQGTFTLKELNIQYSYKYNNGIWTKQGDGIWLFMNGVWATIIYEPI